METKTLVGKKLEVSEIKFLTVKWQCPKCRSSNSNDLFVHGGALQVSCWHCKTVLTRKEPGRWVTDDGTVVMAHEEERIEKFSYRCPCCSHQNEAVNLDGLAYDPFHTHRVRKGAFGDHERGLFMYCHHCGMELSKGEDGWLVISDGSKRKEYRAIVSYDIEPFERKVHELHWTCPNPACLHPNVENILDKKGPVMSLKCGKCGKEARRTPHGYTMTFQRISLVPINKTPQTTQI